VGWRLNRTLASVVDAWPDPTLGNRVIRLIGAAGVLWGVWGLTREPVPLSPALRLTTRLLAVACLAGSSARLLLLAAIGTNEWVSEPASTLVDGLAMVGCGACCVRLLRSMGDRGWARSAWACSVAYLLATALRVIALVRAAGDGTGNGWALSLAMLTLGVWAWVIASRLRVAPIVGAR
jgi:hypothetical protein